MAPRVGLEPTTLRLTAGCSAIELPRNGDVSRGYEWLLYRKRPYMQAQFKIILKTRREAKK